MVLARASGASLVRSCSLSASAGAGICRPSFSARKVGATVCGTPRRKTGWVFNVDRRRRSQQTRGQMGFELARFAALALLLACPACADSRAQPPAAHDTTADVPALDVLESAAPGACGALDEPCCRDRSLLCAPG